MFGLSRKWIKIAFKGDGIFYLTYFVQSYTPHPPPENSCNAIYKFLSLDPNMKFHLNSLCLVLTSFAMKLDIYIRQFSSQFQAPIMPLCHKYALKVQHANYE